MTCEIRRYRDESHKHEIEGPREKENKTMQIREILAKSQLGIVS